MVAGTPTPAQTPSRTFYSLTKQLNYVQTWNAAPVPASLEAAKFEIFGEAADSVRLSSGNTMSFPADDGFGRVFASRAAMDTAFPTGTYTMTPGTVTKPPARRSWFSTQ